MQWVVCRCLGYISKIEIEIDCVLTLRVILKLKLLPLPSTPITPEDNSINLPPIYRSPLPHAPTYGVKESPPAPKTHELVGDDVTFILGTCRSSTPQCYTQCKRVPHSFHNVEVANENTLLHCVSEH